MLAAHHHGAVFIMPVTSAVKPHHRRGHSCFDDGISTLRHKSAQQHLIPTNEETTKQLRQRNLVRNTSRSVQCRGTTLFEQARSV